MNNKTNKICPKCGKEYKVQADDELITITKKDMEKLKEELEKKIMEKMEDNIKYHLSVVARRVTYKHVYNDTNEKEIIIKYKGVEISSTRY